MKHSLLLPASKIAMDSLLSSLLVAALPQLPSLMMIVCWLSYYIVSYVFAVCIYCHFILVVIAKCGLHYLDGAAIISGSWKFSLQI